MPPPPPRPPPPLMDELIEEVLLRLPPDSPASLVRAGLVCKRWCNLISDPGFQRRLLDFHRQAPPMLGFLIYSDELTYRDIIAARFVPTTASGSSSGLPHANHCGLRPCDSRHGRVVLLRTYSSFGIIIWNPITGEQLKLPNPPSSSTGSHPYNWTAAVLCAATATGACNHLDCHRRGSFIVVLVGDTTFREKFTCIFSSEAGVWSKPTVAPQPPESASSIASWTRSTLVGNALYFVLEGYKSILEYNLCTRRTSVIKLPGEGKNKRPESFGPIQLTTMEDGRLGFVRVVELNDYSRLCLWSREDEEPVGWVLSKVIELDKLLPLDDRRPTWHYNLVGSAEGVGTIFLKLKDELFTVDLRSGRVTKVYTHHGLCLTNVVVPYVNFCTPVFRAPSTIDEPVGASAPPVSSKKKNN